MANEIHDANGSYVGYYNVRRNEIRDVVRKGGLNRATANAGRKGAGRNPAMRMTSQQAREQKRRRDRAYQQRRRGGR